MLQIWLLLLECTLKFQQRKEDEFVELELVAGIEVPNYVLIPEYLECMSSSGGSQTEDLDIENILSTLEIDNRKQLRNQRNGICHLHFTQDVCLIKNSWLLKME